MTVGELIKALKQFPEEMIVVTNGYESGYEEILYPETIEVRHEPENCYWDGEYQVPENAVPGTLKVVAVFRNRRDD
jgi:hypothetical protein